MPAWTRPSLLVVVLEECVCVCVKERERDGRGERTAMKAINSLCRHQTPITPCKIKSSSLSPLCLSQDFYYTIYACLYTDRSL